MLLLQAKHRGGIQNADRLDRIEITGNFMKKDWPTRAAFTYSTAENNASVIFSIPSELVLCGCAIFT